MRVENALSVVAILLAFFSGYLVLSVKNSRPLDLTNVQLQQEVAAFQTAVPPTGEVPVNIDRDLMDPGMKLPTWHLLPLETARALRFFEKTCEKKPLGSQDPMVMKTIQWIEHKCVGTLLAEEFFHEGPTFHPSGHTFAHLAGRTHGRHVLELEGVSGVPEALAFYARLHWKTHHHVLQGEKIIIDPTFVLIREQDERERFKIYRRDAWEQYWKNSVLTPAPVEKGQVCFFREGQVCWNYDITKNLFQRWNALTVMLILSVGLTLLALGSLILRMRQREAQEKRLKFALEMLAHEVRTPVTNMGLHLEGFRRDFDRQGPEAQKGLLRLFDQVERLKRIIQASQNYLRKDLGTEILRAAPVELSSLRSFLEHTLDPYLEQITFTQVSDGPVTTDPFWASLCIKNVVENALRHGKSPVTVEAAWNPGEWSVKVRDQGTAKFNPKEKGKDSPGLGLGHKLITEVLPHLHGTITYDFSPTTVSLSFKRIT